MEGPEAVTQNYEQSSLSGADTELVPDYIYGVRSWMLTPPGPAGVPGLRGAYKHVWTPGLNTALCAISSTKFESLTIRVTESAYQNLELAVKRHELGIDHLYSEYSQLDVLDQTLRAQLAADREIAAQHKLDPASHSWHCAQIEMLEYVTVADFRLDGDNFIVNEERWPMVRIHISRRDDECGGRIAPACRCGFYAYTTQAAVDNLGVYFSTPSTKDNRVIGVIRGSGLTTVGTRGFRTQNAEIVAIAPYPYSSIEGLEHIASFYGVKYFDTALSMGMWARDRLSSSIFVPAGSETDHLIRTNTPRRPPTEPPVYKWS